MKYFYVHVTRSRGASLEEDSCDRIFEPYVTCHSRFGYRILVLLRNVESRLRIGVREPDLKDPFETSRRPHTCLLGKESYERSEK